MLLTRYSSFNRLFVPPITPRFLNPYSQVTHRLLYTTHPSCCLTQRGPSLTHHIIQLPVHLLKVYSKLSPPCCAFSHWLFGLSPLTPRLLRPYYWPFLFMWGRIDVTQPLHKSYTGVTQPSQQAHKRYSHISLCWHLPLLRPYHDVTQGLHPLYYVLHHFQSHLYYDGTPKLLPFNSEVTLRLQSL